MRVICCNEENHDRYDRYNHMERYENASRFKTVLYMNLFKRASAILTKYHTCVNCPDMGSCCASCGYCSEYGCTIMALSCRTWLCMRVEYSANGKVMRAFKQLYDIAVYYNLYNEFFNIRYAPHYIRSLARPARIIKKGMTKTLLPSFKRQAQAKVRHRA